MFADREDAGRKLGTKLMRFKGQDACIFALPRGGVPVGFEIARMLGAPLDLIIVRKLGAPHQPELAIGALADGEHPQIVLNDDIVTMLRVSGEYIAEEKERQLLEIERRRQSYLAGRPRASASRRIAIIVDDGIATGATIRAAIRSIRAAKPARLVLAVPVAPTETIAALRREADEIVCLEAHEDFMAISIYYRNFRQLDDEEVRDLLARIPSPPPAATPEQRA
jgi:putative phosphoribosyl transferase